MHFKEVHSRNSRWHVITIVYVRKKNETLVSTIMWSEMNWKSFSCVWFSTTCSLSGSSVHGILQARIMEWVQCSSVAQVCPTLCDPMDHSTPGLPVHHKLPESTQTHAHQVGDAIQPSHPLLSPSPPAPNPSQHQGLLLFVNSSHRVAKVLEFQLQHQSFQWTLRTHLGSG